MVSSPAWSRRRTKGLFFSKSAGVARIVGEADVSHDQLANVFMQQLHALPRVRQYRRTKESTHNVNIFKTVARAAKPR